MKDFISKVTFGFIMAQLLPGAVVVFAITCTLDTKTCGSEEPFQQVILNVGSAWFGDSFKAASFLLISVAVGMCIHGLNWAILACWSAFKKKRAGSLLGVTCIGINCPYGFSCLSLRLQ